LGEKASDLAMKEKFGLKADYTGKGSRTFDKVYIEYVYMDDATGKVVNKVKVVDKVKVVEAKGGSSDVGSKTVAGGEVAEQGTREYMDQTLKEMEARGGKDAEVAGEIRQALAAEKLEYYKVSQKVDVNGNLKPIEIKKFDIE
jgi:hypothetical protein